MPQLLVLLRHHTLRCASAWLWFLYNLYKSKSIDYQATTFYTNSTNAWLWLIFSLWYFFKSTRFLVFCATGLSDYSMGADPNAWGQATSCRRPLHMVAQEYYSGLDGFHMILNLWIGLSYVIVLTQEYNCGLDGLYIWYLIWQIGLSYVIVQYSGIK